MSENMAQKIGTIGVAKIGEQNGTLVIHFMTKMNLKK